MDKKATGTSALRHLWEMSQNSLGGAEYFLSFTDDKTRHTWVYVLSTKDQVFDGFKSRETDQKLKVL